MADLAKDPCPECGYPILVDGTMRAGDSFACVTELTIEASGATREVVYHVPCHEAKERREARTS